MSGSTLKKIVGRFYPLKRLAFFSQRLLTNPRHREFAAELACKRLPYGTLQTQLYNKDVEDLRRDGYVMLENLIRPEDAIEMVNWFSNKLTYDRWNEAGGYFNPAQPPLDCHTAPFSTEDIIKSPHALKWINNEKILAIVEKVLGAKPTLSNLSVWWSYPGHDKPQEAENFHRDVDDLRFIKLFIYLTDVDMKSGPHVFIPKSHNHMGYRKIRRYTDQEIERDFGKDGIKYFTGKQGTAFLENTFGLHKGQLPHSKRRLLFQAQYSLHPIGVAEYSNIELPESQNKDLDKYINRLYVK